jgi:CBS domain-containing protein
MRSSFVDATRKAAYVGQTFAFLFGVIGLFMGNPMLMVIALFVWIGAAQESGMAHMNRAISGIPVSEAMVTDFKVLNHDDRLEHAIALTIAGSQKEFPVMRDGNIVGVLSESALLAAIRSHGEQIKVGLFMQQSFTTVEANAMLDRAFQKLSDCRCHTVPVLNGDRLVGLLTMDNVGEFVRIQSALASRRRHSDLPNSWVPFI